MSTKYGRQSTEGGARGGRLSVDGACNQEPDGDTRLRDSDLDRFRPSGRCNTLRPVSLVYCIEMYRSVEICPLGDPYLSLLLWRGRVTRKVSYLVLYNVLRSTLSSAVHAFILWARPPLMVRPTSCLVDTGGHTPTHCNVLILEMQGSPRDNPENCYWGKTL